MPGSDPATGSRGFTLVELILVMAVLAIVMAFVAPTLSNSLRGRALEQEAARFVALTEFARDEAISQGSAMNVWVDLKAQRFGVLPEDSYANSSATREYALPDGVHFDAVEGALLANDVAISLRPDGTPSISSIESIKMVDRFGSAIAVSRQANGWGYEVTTPEK